MKLQKEVVYEKMGNALYLSVKDETFVLDDEVSLFVFELLKNDYSKEKIKHLVKQKFDSTEEFSDEEKDLYVEEFLIDLQENHLVV